MSEYTDKMNDIIIHRVLKRLQDVEHGYTKVIIDDNKKYINYELNNFKTRILICYVVSMLMFLHLTFIVIFS